MAENKLVDWDEINSEHTREQNGYYDNEATSNMSGSIKIISSSN